MAEPIKRLQYLVTNYATFVYILDFKEECF